MKKAEKPTGAFCAVFIGALVILLVGLYYYNMAITYSFYLWQPYEYLRIPSIMLSILGFGLLLLSFGLRTIAEKYSNIGKIIIILSVTSLFFGSLCMLLNNFRYFGDIVIMCGAILGLVGGIKALKWRRSQPPPPPLITAQKEVPPQVMREKEVVRMEKVIVKVRCQYCNRLYDETENECPHCRGSR